MRKIINIFEKENNKLLEMIERNCFVKVLAEPGMGLAAEMEQFLAEKGIRLIDMSFFVREQKEGIYASEKVVFLYEDQDQIVKAIGEFGFYKVIQSGGILKMTTGYDLFNFNSAFFDHIRVGYEPIIYRFTEEKKKKLIS